MASSAALLGQADKEAMMAEEKRETFRAPTTDRLREDIDSSETGDKVNYPDPAAAPLGTDDEAAGMAAGPARRAEAYREEISRPKGAEPKRWWIIFGVPGLLVALLLGLVLLGTG